MKASPRAYPLLPTRQVCCKAVSRSLCKVLRGFALSRTNYGNYRKSFTKDVGEEAQTQGIVPSFVSSNAFIAKCYAKVIVEFANGMVLQDC